VQDLRHRLWGKTHCWIWTVAKPKFDLNPSTFSISRY
jgi:hypothetical protein